MSQEDTGTTDEDPNDYLDNLDDIYADFIASPDADSNVDVPLGLIALTIEVRKARQALEAIAASVRPKDFYTAAVAEGRKHTDQLKDAFEKAAQNAREI